MFMSIKAILQSIHVRGSSILVCVFLTVIAAWAQAAFNLHRADEEKPLASCFFFGYSAVVASTNHACLF